MGIPKFFHLLHRQTSAPVSSPETPYCGAIVSQYKEVVSHLPGRAASMRKRAGHVKKAFHTPLHTTPKLV